MSAIDTILVATDLSPASEEAVKYAVELASASGAHVELAHVMNGHVMMPRELWRPPSDRERAADLKRATRELHQLASRVGNRRVPIECVVVHGDPRDQIPRLANQVHAQLIVMTQARCFLGSIVETVMRDTNVPVLVAPRADGAAAGANKEGIKCDSPAS